MDTGRPVFSKKAAAVEVNHTPLSRDMVKNLFCHTPTLPYISMAQF